MEPAKRAWIAVQLRTEAEAFANTNADDPRAIWREVERLAQVDKAASFELFCERLVKITTKIPGEVLPLKLNRAQRRIQELRTGWDVILKARQLGITTIELARDIWFALLNQHSTVYVVCQPDKQNKHIRKLVEQLAFMLDNMAIGHGASCSGSTYTFGNGAKIVVTDAGGTEKSATKQGRGSTIHRLHITELAFFPYAEAFVTACLRAVPTPEHGGEVVEESTPNGASGLFYQHVCGARLNANGFGFIFIPWMMDDAAKLGDDTSPADPVTPDEQEVCDCAIKYCDLQLTKAQLAWWRQEVARNTLNNVLQEACHDPDRCFLLSGYCYFDTTRIKEIEARCSTGFTPESVAQEAQRTGIKQDAIAALLKKFNRSKVQLLRVWSLPRPDEEYELIIDSASGSKDGDWLVAVVFSRRTREVCAVLRAQVETSEFARWCVALAKTYNLAWITPERNNQGHTTIHVITNEERYERVRKGADDKYGFNTGPHNRQQIIDDLQDALAEGSLLKLTRDQQFCIEARTFVRGKNGRVAASNGNHDDVIMAYAIGWHVLSQARPERPFGQRKAVGQERGTY